MKLKFHKLETKLTKKKFKFQTTKVFSFEKHQEPSAHDTKLFVLYTTVVISLMKRNKYTCILLSIIIVMQ